MYSLNQSISLYNDIYRLYNNKAVSKIAKSRVCVIILRANSYSTMIYFLAIPFLIFIAITSSISVDLIKMYCDNSMW